MERQPGEISKSGALVEYFLQSHDKNTDGNTKIKISMLTQIVTNAFALVKTPMLLLLLLLLMLIMIIMIMIMIVMMMMMMMMMMMTMIMTSMTMTMTMTLTISTVLFLNLSSTSFFKNHP